MKVRAFILLILSLAALQMSSALRAQAQTVPALSAPPAVQGGPVPPAYTIGLRLYNTSLQAQQTNQLDLAHRRAYQAVKKFQEVPASATFRKTPFAAEALFNEAQLEEKVLKSNATAITAYQTLHNTYAQTDYPSKALAETERDRVELAEDRLSQTVQPGILGTISPVLYKTLDFLVHLTGARSYSYWIAILLISVLVKLALTPLSNAQYSSMREMQKHQPEIKKIQEKFKGDKEAQGRKVMEFYKENGINPAAGCLPLLVQLPILYMLYFMIRLYQYQFAKGTFLWIGSGISHQYPSFLGINLGQPDIPILLLYALSMYIQQRMIVSPDPQQAEQQRTMAILTPFMTTYFFLQYHLPSAFVLYYLIFNVLSTAQQQYYMKKRSAGDTNDGGGGSKVISVTPPNTPNGGGRVKALPRNGNGGSGGTRRLTTSRETTLAEASADVESKPGDKFSRPQSTNGAAPTARGVIAPTKVHPKKKRR